MAHIYNNFTSGIIDLAGHSRYARDEYHAVSFDEIRRRGSRRPTCAPI